MDNQPTENPCAFDNVDGQKITIRDRSGILSDDDFEEYWCTLYEGPFRVHLDRENVRHGLWKQYDAIDQARQVKIKGDRVMHTYERLSGADRLVQDTMVILSELDDVINYAVFAKRLIQGTI